MAAGKRLPDVPAVACGQGAGERRPARGLAGPG